MQSSRLLKVVCSEWVIFTIGVVGWLVGWLYTVCTLCVMWLVMDMKPDQILPAHCWTSHPPMHSAVPAAVIPAPVVLHSQEPDLTRHARYHCPPLCCCQQLGRQHWHRP